MVRQMRYPVASRSASDEEPHMFGSKSSDGLTQHHPGYQSGFGNEFATEAEAGALPVGQNSPQKAPLGLYTEQLSGSPFTAPRHLNRRAWTYRIRPSVMHKPYERIANGLVRSTPFDEVETTPSQLRWDPLPLPTKPTDFIDGLTTLAGNG